MTRPCYAMDLPKGVRLVHDDVIVLDVQVGAAPDGPGNAVYVLCDDLCVRCYPPNEHLEIDEDTPERRQRLEFAQAVLDGDVGRLFRGPLASPGVAIMWERLSRGS